MKKYMHVMVIGLSVAPACFMVTAQTVAQQVTWHATAVKGGSSTMELVSPGLQLVARGSAHDASKELAATMTTPQGGHKFKVRTTHDIGDQLVTRFNGQVINTHYTSILNTEQFYLSYQLKDPSQQQAIFETGYQLVAYW